MTPGHCHNTYGRFGAVTSSAGRALRRMLHYTHEGGRRWSSGTSDPRRSPLARVPATVPAVLASALFLLLFFGAPAAHGAATLHVNAATGEDSESCGTATPCQTIGQAVANASAGDTIEVAAGTYPEFLTIDKSLTLKGAQAGNAGSAARAEAPDGESVVDDQILVLANNVTVDGFSFGCECVQLRADGNPLSGVVIENNVFSGYFAVGVALDSPGDIQVTRNYFRNPAENTAALQLFVGTGSQGAHPNGHCNDAVVSNNIFDAATTNGTADIFFNCINQGSPSSVITVSGNQSSGNTRGESLVVFRGIVGGLNVEGNTAANPSGSAMFFNTNPLIGTVDITGNTVTGGLSNAIRLTGTGGGAGTFVITGNNLSGNRFGFSAAAGALASGATVVLHGNDLSGNSVNGVFNGSAGGGVDATSNWWGCNSGPGASGCATVAGDVTFDPWLVLNVSASPSSVLTGGSSTVTADLTRNSDGADTSGSWTIPDGTSVGFATDLGTLSASSAGTSAGKASVTLSSSSAGTAHVSATLDSQTVSTEVTFSLTAASLCTLTRELVTKSGVADGLCAKLNAAGAAAARGDLNAKRGALRAFANQLAAQTGKSITAANAATLEQLAAGL
jgi:hypothetical protein